MSKLVRNEQKKLRATYFNGVAVAAIGVGGLTQAATMVQALKVSPVTTIFIVVCVFLSYALHSVGRVALAGLEE